MHRQGQREVRLPFRRMHQRSCTPVEDGQRASDGASQPPRHDYGGKNPDRAKDRRRLQYGGLLLTIPSLLCFDPGIAKEFVTEVDGTDALPVVGAQRKEERRIAGNLTCLPNLSRGQGLVAGRPALLTPATVQNPALRISNPRYVNTGRFSH